MTVDRLPNGKPFTFHKKGPIYLLYRPFSNYINFIKAFPDPDPGEQGIENRVSPSSTDRGEEICVRIQATPDDHQSDAAASGPGWARWAKRWEMLGWGEFEMQQFSWGLSLGIIVLLEFVFFSTGRERFQGSNCPKARTILPLPHVSYRSHTGVSADDIIGGLGKERKMDSDSDVWKFDDGLCWMLLSQAKALGWIGMVWNPDPFDGRFVMCLFLAYHVCLLRLTSDGDLMSLVVLWCSMYVRGYSLRFCNGLLPSYCVFFFFL